MYTDMIEIMELNIPEHVKVMFDKSFGKHVYFEDNGKTEVGILYGVLGNNYVLWQDDDFCEVPFTHSLFQC